MSGEDANLEDVLRRLKKRKRSNVDFFYKPPVSARDLREAEARVGALPAAFAAALRISDGFALGFVWLEKAEMLVTLGKNGPDMVSSDCPASALVIAASGRGCRADGSVLPGRRADNACGRVPGVLGHPGWTAAAVAEHCRIFAVLYG